MINTLIEDFAGDRVSISIALSMSKVIAKRLGIENFSSWVTNELNDYPLDSTVPEYRKFPCQIKGEVMDAYGRKSTGVILDVTRLNEQLDFDLYKHEEKQSIQNIEYVLSKSDGHYVGVPFPQNIVRGIPLGDRTVTLLSAYKEVPKSDVNEILIQVKQRLLDLLLEIESKYPEVAKTDKALNKDEVELVSNMVTYNLYGNHNNTPLAIGNKVNQSTTITITQNNIEQTLDELSKLGIEKPEVEELRVILEDKELIKTKSSMKKRILNWFGKLTMKVAEKGIDIELPHVLDKVNRYIELLHS